MIKKTVTKISIHDKSDSPIIGETVINVSLKDEGAGVFLEISTPNDGSRDLKPGQIFLNPEELILVAEAGAGLIDDVEKNKRLEDYFKASRELDPGAYD